MDLSKAGNLKSHIGMGLNEGYKDVLLERYFGVEPQFPALCGLAKLLEDLVGQGFMESQFFDGDLYKMVRAMKEMTCSENAREWLMKFDTVYKALQGSYVSKAIAETIYRDCCRFV